MKNIFLKAKEINPKSQKLRSIFWIIKKVWSTILCGNFLHLLSHIVWRRTILPFSSLLEADTIFYRAINKTWHFFSSLQSPLWYVTGLWRQCYIIPHGFTASERDSWVLLCIFTALPSNLSLCSLLLCSCLNGGLVKCIIYPCLPPCIRNHTKRRAFYLNFNTALPALPLRSYSWSRDFRSPSWKAHIQ